VVEVPVGVDEDLNGVGIDSGEGGNELGLAGSVAGVDEELAFFGGEYGDVAASSAEEGDVAAEGSSGDLVVGVGGASSGEEVLWVGRLLGWLLGKESAGIEAGCRGCDCRGGEKVAAGECRRWLDHEIVLCTVDDTWGRLSSESVEAVFGA
jgi:hypothetical protein